MENREFNVYAVTLEETGTPPKYHFYIISYLQMLYGCLNIRCT